jgi:hypothetical protein
MDAFEKRWPIGSTPRLVYELALWLGARRCDLAKLRPEDIRGDLMVWKQRKTGNDIVLPITRWVAEALAATDLSGPTIVKTQAGEPFSIKSLTGRMRDWTGSAGLKAAPCTVCARHSESASPMPRERRASRWRSSGMRRWNRPNSTAARPIARVWRATRSTSLFRWSRSGARSADNRSG